MQLRYNRNGEIEIELPEGSDCWTPVDPEGDSALSQEVAQAIEDGTPIAPYAPPMPGGDWTWGPRLVEIIGRD